VFIGVVVVLAPLYLGKSFPVASVGGIGLVGGLGNIAVRSPTRSRWPSRDSTMLVCPVFCKADVFRYSMLANLLRMLLMWIRFSSLIGRRSSAMRLSYEWINILFIPRLSDYDRSHAWITVRLIPVPCCCLLCVFLVLIVVVGCHCIDTCVAVVLTWRWGLGWR